MAWRVIAALAASVLVTWVVLVVSLVVARPKGGLLKEAMRLLPDTLRLLRSLAADRGLPSGVRIRLWLVFGYLAMPFDIIPDFIPVLGYADDAIIVCMVLRSVVRSAGTDVVRRNWTGSEEGLAALSRVAGLPMG